MTDETKETIETEETQAQAPQIEETRPLPYAKDPLYKDLLKNYQNADWGGAMQVITSLLEQYPDDPALLDFQTEVQMRVKMQDSGQEADREEKKQQLSQLSIRALIGLAVIAVVFFIVRAGINYYNDTVGQAREQREQAALAQTLAAKFENAENFMLAGRISEALALFEEIQAIDPEYENITAKIQEAKDGLALEELYLQGRSEYEAGDFDAALVILQQVMDQDSRYKDAALIVKTIENSMAIEDLRAEAKLAYQNNEWKAVVDAHDEILRIDNTADVSDLEVELFTSYMNLVIDTADRGDASVQDVEQAEKYYRAALAIFPQNREFAREREELQRVAIELLASKYYIYALELIDQEDYSIQSMEEALRLLNRASNIGSGSPAIASEISQLTLFLTAFDNFVARRWEEAIDGMEQLYRLDPNYANGMLKYLLYETYLARGDTFYSFAEYSNARADYELSETYAWGDEGNKLRLFQIEIRIGFTLRRLSLPAEASEYYRYAIGLVNFVDKLGNSDQEQLNTYLEAESSFGNADYWNSARLYEIFLEDTEPIFQFETITISRGDSLAHIAFQYGSSVDTILLFNNRLGDSLIARSDQEIRIPTLVEDQN